MGEGGCRLAGRMPAALAASPDDWSVRSMRAARQRVECTRFCPLAGVLPMSDRYLEFANSNLGRRLVGAFGLPRPVPLQRWVSGRSRPVEGAILLGGGTLAGTLAPTLKRLSNELFADRDGLSELTRWTGAGKLQALVFDASDLHSADQLIALQRFFQPALPHLEIGRASCRERVANSVMEATARDATSIENTDV